MNFSVQRSTPSAPLRILTSTALICDLMTSYCCSHSETVGAKNQMNFERQYYVQYRKFPDCRPDVTAFAQAHVSFS